MKLVDRSVLYFRRCHICSGISECQGAVVVKCEHCGKPMAPFFFFDEFRVEPHSDQVSTVIDELPSGERRPVKGFTAVW